MDSESKQNDNDDNNYDDIKLNKVNIDEVYIIKSQEDDIIFSNQPIGKDNSDVNRFGKLKQNLLGLSDITGEDFNEEITENA